MMLLLNIFIKFYLIIIKDFLKGVVCMSVIMLGEGFCFVFLGEFVICIWRIILMLVLGLVFWL